MTETQSDAAEESTASETFSRTALVEDLRTLAEALEDLHADPYRGYGGKLGFHRRLERLVETTPEEATPAEFHRHVSPLVTGLRDGHTRLSPPTDDTDDRELPVSIRVVGDGLFVDGVHEEGPTSLLGARLTAVEGHSVSTLLDRRSLKAAENRSGERYRLASRLEEYDRLDRLLGRDDPPDPVTVTATNGDRTIETSLAPVSGVESLETLPATVPAPDGSGPRYRLYEDGAGAVFVPGDLQGFRESYESLLTTGSDLPEELAPEAYRRHVGEDPPEDVDEVVAALPSMMETVVDLAETMADAGTETLVVDLRDNPGGDSTFVYHLAYVLRGWEGVVDAAESISVTKRRTDAHRERYGVPEDEPSTAERNPASYDFESDLGDEPDRAATLDRLRDTLTRSETAAKFVTTDDAAGVYDPPQLVVLTSAGTFSSAFAGVAQLSTLGADVVGVPSAQAPVSYGEVVDRTLPNTGLEASIAAAAFEWLPDPSGPVLDPDRELTAGLFRQFDRADDAVLRLAFEHVGLTDGDPPEPI